jgi:hypothetical protein
LQPAERISPLETMNPSNALNTVVKNAIYVLQLSAADDCQPALKRSIQLSEKPVPPKARSNVPRTVSYGRKCAVEVKKESCFMQRDGHMTHRHAIN